MIIECKMNRKVIVQKLDILDPFKESLIMAYFGIQLLAKLFNPRRLR